jgi:hypothetical protein
MKSQNRVSGSDASARKENKGKARSSRRFLIALCIWTLSLVTMNRTWGQTIQDADFSTLSGHIYGVVDLNPLDPAPASMTQVLGGTAWTAMANAVTTGTLGFRPTVEANDIDSPGTGYLGYGVASLGGLAGLEMPDSYIWQALSGSTIGANKTYTLSLTLDAGIALNASALAARGVGIGILAGASTSAMGTMVADSLSSPSSLTITPLSGTAEQLTLTFTASATPPGGTLGIVMFAGRGTQTLQLSLMNDYQFDNVTLVTVPEGRSMVMMISGVAMLIQRRRLRRR